MPGETQCRRCGRISVLQPDILAPVKCENLCVPRSKGFIKEIQKIDGCNV
jgi:hypothetical protein